MEDQEAIVIDNLNDFFDPSAYLVSPFNSTKKFIYKEYFLTQQQESIKKNILKTINQTSGNFMSITGNAGTGKTLLLYDIVNELMNQKKVLLVHCAHLNHGHHELLQHHWAIISIKHFRDRISELVQQYDIIVIDESQRLYKSQLQSIGNIVNQLGKKCIFAYDQNQTLSSWERTTNIEQYLSTIPADKNHKLTKK